MKKFLDFAKFVVSQPSTRVSIDFRDSEPLLELDFFNEDGRETNPYRQFFTEKGIKDYQEEVGNGEFVTYKLPVDILEVPRILEGELEVIELLFFLIRNASEIERNFEFFHFCIHPGHLPEVKYLVYRDLCMEREEKEAFKAARKFITKLLLKFPQLEEAKTTISFLEDIGPVRAEVDLLTLP